MSLILARAVDPSRKPFGKSLKDHDLFLAQLAELRLEIESARLLVLNAADMIDRVGAKGALTHIAIAKVCRSNAMRLTCRSSSLKLQDECWIEPFKSMVQKGCARIN